MKTLFSLLLVISFHAVASAREIRVWSFKQMLDKADLVVVAKPTSTKDTSETTILATANVVGIETEFSVRAVLKGSQDVEKLVLHHYRFGANNHLFDGPRLFDPSVFGSFLLFLKREPDGRYAPVNGQENPDGTSIQKLAGRCEF